ncbi:DUF2800 domain-containing protein [Brevibacillus laterosporus]|uniref:DUF2800 domain-containing protein n=1 Tax=Brevibacillus laterosporus TaxID=1465 RepID=UPI00195E241B|nr:DUF2800 domain-containing protein [Brevibacillus laterosporus]MBM7106864.1 PD-(D/E)XK nuclease superfamily protein [Brevibacillus laterosporus]
MSVAHSERAHAVLSASGSKRWMSCTPSAQLEQLFPNSTSEFAEEGTAAHELSELHLGLYLGEISKRAFNKKLKEQQAGKYYSQSMSDYVHQYVDKVIERINEARMRSKDTIVLIEQRLDYSAWVPEGFGTGDVVIISDGIMEIIDLKYGKGVPVSAKANTQMRLYGLGALNLFGFLYDIETVRMTIVQPRLDSISTDEITAEGLLLWAESEVKPLAEKANAGEGEFSPGEHCRFCRAKAICRARAEANLEMAKYEFREPTLLTYEEIGEILAQADELQKWAADVQAYAFNQAEKHGVKFPGWKLVEGRSNRKYADKDTVTEVLLAEGLSEDVIYEPKSILGISAMEKAIGKKLFNQLLGEHVIKPVGKPTLVPESDSRPELSTAASAKADFADD